MQIGNLIFHHKSYLKRVITDAVKKNKEQGDVYPLSINFWICVGIYESSVFGVCFYRSDHCTNKFLKEVGYKSKD